MRIAHDRFEPVVRAVLPDVIGAQNAEVRELLLCLLLSDVLQIHGSSKSSNSQGPLPSSRPGTRLPGTSLSYSDANNDIPLFCFVSNSPSSIKPCGEFYSVNRRLPSPFDHRLSEMLFEPSFFSLIPRFD